MASVSTGLRPYAELEASSNHPSQHQLYFVPLDELHRAVRSDSTHVVVVAFIGRTAHSKSLLANFLVDQPVFLVRAFQFPSAILPCYTIFSSLPLSLFLITSYQHSQSQFLLFRPCPGSDIHPFVFFTDYRRGMGYPSSNPFRN